MGLYWFFLPGHRARYVRGRGPWGTKRGIEKDSKGVCTLTVSLTFSRGDRGSMTYTDFSPPFPSIPSLHPSSLQASTFPFGGAWSSFNFRRSSSTICRPSRPSQGRCAAERGGRGRKKEHYLIMGPRTSHTRTDFLSEFGLFGPDRRGGDVQQVRRVRNGK